ncbi:MAG: hypothetical protein JO301_11460, partial [Chitinophagaceae bacterium]|nr:hypothetical protein [Chitinophagaceae bacterium]
WLTEYVFTPLSIAFRDYGKAGLSIAILINFILVGAWHGANWTFVLFGLLHGLYFIPLIIRDKMAGITKRPKQHAGGMRHYLNILGTFVLVMLSFIVFRSDNVQQAWEYFRRLFSASIFSLPAFAEKKQLAVTLLFVTGFLVMEWRGKQDNYAIEKQADPWPAPLRWGFYYLLLSLILVYNESQQHFIYAKF